MADIGQTAHAGQSISVKVDGSNIQITLQGQAQGPSRSVGWGAVEDAVQKDDERQVQSCKEDIDSLLTFAGLYSAALTALLALSFAMLQEDTASESLQVLRQIALQTATYQLLPGGGLNSTAAIPPPSSSPFEPSRAALRVNILWFASLVFSLSTASIGILVKQWLRAYVSYQTSSAQGRMRVRYFRHQGIEIWKVYEIAAVLPFIIQLALGLFFVGLCYFTAGVHADLGHATLPLVAGWALFVFAVTLLPLVSSHCPYKPALSEGLFSAIRPRLFSFITEVCVFMDRLTRRPLAFNQSIFFSTYRLIWRMWRMFTGGLAFVDRSWLALLVRETSSQVWTPLNRFAGAITANTVKVLQVLNDLLLTDTSEETELEEHFFGRLTLWARKHTRASPHHPYDETDAVKFGGKDAEVLVFADALQSDDELLATTITDAVKQSQPTIENIAAFVVGVLRSRDITELNVEDEPPSTPLDCRSLTPRAATAIADVVVQHLDLIRHDAPPRVCQWLYRTLLSLSRPLQAGSLFLNTLTLCVEYPWVLSFQIQDMLKRFSKPPDQSLRLVLSAFRLFWISEYLPSHTADSGSEILSKASFYVSNLLEAILGYAGLSAATLSEDFTDGSLERRMIFNDFPLQDTIEWLAGLVRQEVESKQKDIDATSVRKTLELIFRLSRLDFISRSSQRAKPSWDIQASLMHDCSKYCVQVNSIEELQWAIRCYAENPSKLAWKHDLTLKQYVDFADQNALQHLYHAVANFNIDNVSASNKSVACARICHVIVDIFSGALYEEKMIAPLVRLWRRILRHVTLMLPDPGESHKLPEDTEDLVSIWLYTIIDTIDRGNQYKLDFDDDEIKREKWRNQFKSEESPFSNHFVFLLSKLLSEETRAKYVQYYWRLQMVEEKYKEDEDAVLKDDEHDDDEGASEQKDGEGGSTKPVEDEGTDGGAQRGPERTTSEQSDRAATEAQTSDGAAPELIAPPIGNSADANKSEVANNASNRLAADSSLGHAGGSDAGDSDRAHDEGSGLKTADEEEPDDTKASGLPLPAGDFTRDMISDCGEQQQQSVAGSLGDAHNMESASATGDHSGADSRLASVGSSHVVHPERVSDGGDEKRGTGENRSRCSEETVDESAEAQTSNGDTEPRDNAPSTATGNSDEVHEAGMDDEDRDRRIVDQADPSGSSKDVP